jgi:sugar O-acyltransferase (sialic acid O-acetyltransferase NeuD family)
MQKAQSGPKELVFWGGTGQCKVMRGVAESQGYELVAVVDDTPDLKLGFEGVPLFHGAGEFTKWYKNRGQSSLGFVITIGNPHGRTRIKLGEFLKSIGLHPVSLIHSSAIIAKNVTLGEGLQIHAGAIIETDSRIGNYCILNTGSQIDHDTDLADGVEIGPGAVLCGEIKIESCAWVAAGATVLPRLNIASDSIVGAGALVTKNVEKDQCVWGVPAKPRGK